MNGPSTSTSMMLTAPLPFRSKRLSYSSDRIGGPKKRTSMMSTVVLLLKSAGLRAVPLRVAAKVEERLERQQVHQVDRIVGIQVIAHVVQGVWVRRVEARLERKQVHQVDRLGVAPVRGPVGQP